MSQFLNTPKKEHQRGFTLIEMMIVLLVVSILLAIAVPAYMRVRETSKARMCQTNLRHLQDAKERWALDNRKRDSDTPAMEDLISAYLKVEPTCPNGGRYEMGSVGETPECTAGGEHSID